MLLCIIILFVTTPPLFHYIFCQSYSNIYERSKEVTKAKSEI